MIIDEFNFLLECDNLKTGVIIIHIKEIFEMFPLFFIFPSLLIWTRTIKLLKISDREVVLDKFKYVHTI